MCVQMLYSIYYTPGGCMERVRAKGGPFTPRLAKHRRQLL